MQHADRLWYAYLRCSLLLIDGPFAYGNVRLCPLRGVFPPFSGPPR